MVTIAVEGDRLVLAVEGWDKLWALRSRVEIPLAHVRGAHADPEVSIGLFAGLKLAGTHVPGVLSAGTFVHRDGLVFWDVHDPARAIVIDLDHEHYRRLVVEVEDPAAAVRTIEAGMASVARTSTGG
jgi:hypothetical protein